MWTLPEPGMVRRRWGAQEKEEKVHKEEEKAHAKGGVHADFAPACGL